MRSKVAILLAVLAPGAAPVAQGNVTVPATLAGIEGGSSSSIPFGTNQPVRYQCIYDGEDLPWSGPRLIQAIALRADNGDPGTTTFAGKQYVVMTMTMSTTAVRAENATTRFRDNWGQDATLVIGNGRIVLPMQPPVAGVRPANIVLPFDAPWIFGTTPVRVGPPPGNLLLELQIALQPAGAYRLDNVGNCDSQPTAFGNRGPACLTSRGVALALTGDSTMQAGSSHTWTVTGMPSSAVFSVVLAATDQGTMFGQPLPLALFDPQNPLGPVPGTPFAYGAPDCWINVPMGFSLLGTADAAGTGRVIANLPPGRRFVGTQFYTQATVFDLSANPLLFVTSAGLRSTVCGPLGVARIYSVGNHQAEIGQLSLGQGAIFDVQ